MIICSQICANGGTESFPLIERRKNHHNNGKKGSHQEEIELQCVFEGRQMLVRGRHFCDTANYRLEPWPSPMAAPIHRSHAPTSSGLIKFGLDPASGKLEHRLSITEVPPETYGRDSSAGDQVSQRAAMAARTTTTGPRLAAARDVAPAADSMADSGGPKSEGSGGGCDAEDEEALKFRAQQIMLAERQSLAVSCAGTNDDEEDEGIINFQEMLMAAHQANEPLLPTPPPQQNKRIDIVIGGVSSSSSSSSERPDLTEERLRRQQQLSLEHKTRDEYEPTDNDLMRKKGQLVATKRPAHNGRMVPKLNLVARRFNDLLVGVVQRSVGGGGGGGRRPSAGAHFTAMISYSHTEAQAYALSLKRELERLGVRTYLDVDEIKKGADWQDSLNEAILNCQAFVALVTPSYGETLWTSRELKLADVLAKHIIPVNFGQSWPPPSLAIQFATMQYVFWLAPDDTDPNARPLIRPFEIRRDSRGRMRTPHWSSKCVKSVARQIKQSIVQRLTAQQALLTANSVNDHHDNHQHQRDCDQLLMLQQQQQVFCSCGARLQPAAVALQQAAADSGYDSSPVYGSPPAAPSSLGPVQPHVNYGTIRCLPVPALQRPPQRRSESGSSSQSSQLTDITADVCNRRCCDDNDDCDNNNTDDDGDRHSCFSGPASSPPAPPLDISLANAVDVAMRRTRLEALRETTTTTITTTTTAAATPKTNQTKSRLDDDNKNSKNNNTRTKLPPTPRDDSIAVCAVGDANHLDARQQRQRPAGDEDESVDEDEGFLLLQSPPPSTSRLEEHQEDDTRQQQQRQLQQQSAPRRKSSIKGRAVKAFNKVKRSLVAPVAAAPKKGRSQADKSERTQKSAVGARR